MTWQRIAAVILVGVLVLATGIALLTDNGAFMIPLLIAAVISLPLRFIAYGLWLKKHG